MEVRRVFHLDLVGVAVAHLVELRHIQIALAELGVLRHGFFFDVEDQGVDERRLLATVFQATFGLILRRALAGVQLAPVVGVALHHVPAVLHELGHHVRARAHRPAVERQAIAGHAGLGIEGIGLPGNGRQKAHRHPVLPLRVLAVNADAQRVRVERLGTGQRPATEVQKGLVLAGGRHTGAQLLVFGADELAVVGQAHHVFREDAEHRRCGTGGGVTFEGVDKIVGCELARAGLTKRPRAALVGDLVGRQPVVEVLALRIPGKGRVRRKQHATLDGNVVDALHNLTGRGRIGQNLPLAAQITRLHHGGRRLGHQRVGTLEVVVAVERFVDLIGVRRLVAAVRRGRVQIAGRAFIEGGVQRVAVGRPHRVGAVIAGGHTQGQAQRHTDAPCPQPAQPRRAFVQPCPALCHALIVS